LVFAALTAFLAAGSAEAFCVYNKTDITIHVAQTRGGAFKKNIPPGGKECCDWQNKDCNPEGKKDSIVRFYVGSEPGYLLGWIIVCNDFPIKAGGWLTIEGKDDNYKCEAHFE